MDNKKDDHNAIVFLVLLVISGSSWANEAKTNRDELEKPPAIDEKPAAADEKPTVADESSEPLSTLDQQADITIIRKKTKTIEEYRINGRLYKVKVTPKFGPPYYLLYPEGSGLSLGEELEGTQTPYWNLFRW